MRIAGLAMVGMLCVSASASTAPQLLSHGRFEQVRMYAPSGETRAAALFLSGAAGWTSQDGEQAAALAATGALVAGIDTQAFLRELDQDGGDCVLPDGDLENLSHFVQAYARQPNYRAPILVGRQAGAGLAYAAAAQAPDGTFAAVMGLDFCPELPLRKPLCASGRLKRTEPIAKDRGAVVLPSTNPSFPFLRLDKETATSCAADAVRAFARSPDHVALEGNRSSLAEAFAQLMQRTQQGLPPQVPAGVSDLPLIEVQAQGPARDRFAILLSGDGGWAGLDKELAGALSKRGIAVVGVDSLRYFWSARTPEGLAADLHRLIQFYSARWHTARVLLLGYSQGGDVLPFALSRLPRASLDRLSLAVPMVPGTEAAFEFHLANWVGASEGLPILPELQKLSALPLLCLYGADEAADSSCSRLDPRRFRVKALPGGHHFDGNYGLLADTILAAAGQ